ncbi:sugar transferase [Nocardioides sp.]|uniref:sugar transferase n=1 Tax=Nocardioides sp. TaxID=35761 RepID=UPI001A20FBD3|nr:sugar transferase [Nocardioides sp.]MBJ7359840.1 sugar transferase [Nocardioides sp.]
MTLIAESPRAVAVSPVNGALRYLTQTALAADVLAMSLAGTLAAVGRDWVFAAGPDDNVSTTLTVAGPVMMLLWLASIAVAGGYRQDLFGAGTDEYKVVLHASVAAAAVVGIGCFLMKVDLSRGFFLLGFGLGIPLLLGARYGLRRALHRARRGGALLQRVVIAGTPTHIDEIAEVLRREAWLGYTVVGALSADATAVDETPCGIPLLGRTDDLVTTVADLVPDVVFFADGASGCGARMRRIVWDLESHDVQVVVAPSVADISGERVRVRPVGGLPLIHIEQPRAVQAGRWAKRAFDLAGSLALLVAFAPLMLVAAARIRWHDGGPVLFRQERVGRDGATFRCLKFRTMVVDAEARLAALQAETGFTYGLFKMKDDPRVTPPGRWLRRLSLDELPQLFNVLRGDMSLIGPRPALPSEAAAYEPDSVRRLRVRPGMTGLWQVSGRSDLSYEEAVRLDMFYVDNWSMIQDLTILLRTLGAVLRARGAY